VLYLLQRFKQVGLMAYSCRNTCSWNFRASKWRFSICCMHSLASCRPGIELFLCFELSMYCWCFFTISAVCRLSKLCVIHRRIAKEYCGGAAATKFPTKYFRIELCVESLLYE